MICFRPPVLKPICRVASEESGLAALDDLEKKWGSEYPLSVKSWRNNWNDLPTLFRYCPLIRKAIHTTNAAENFHRQLRKVTKTKGAFLSEGALMKRIYLTTITKLGSDAGRPGDILSRAECSNNTRTQPRQ